MWQRSLTDKQIRNLKRKAISGVRLNPFVIQKLTPLDIERIANDEGTSVDEIKTILKENKPGNQLTKVESIYYIARLTGHDFHQVITDFWDNGIVLLICLEA